MKKIVRRNWLESRGNGNLWNRLCPPIFYPQRDLSTWIWLVPQKCCFHDYFPHRWMLICRHRASFENRGNYNRWFYRISMKKLQVLIELQKLLPKNEIFWSSWFQKFQCVFSKRQNKTDWKGICKRRKCRSSTVVRVSYVIRLRRMHWKMRSFHRHDIWRHNAANTSRAITTPLLMNLRGLIIFSVWGILGNIHLIKMNCFSKLPNLNCLPIEQRKFIIISEETSFHYESKIQSVLSHLRLGFTAVYTNKLCEREILIERPELGSVYWDTL